MERSKFEKAKEINEKLEEISLFKKYIICKNVNFLTFMVHEIQPDDRRTNGQRSLSNRVLVLPYGTLKTTKKMETENPYNQLKQVKIFWWCIQNANTNIQ